MRQVHLHISWRLSWPLPSQGSGRVARDVTLSADDLFCPPIKKHPRVFQTPRNGHSGFPQERRNTAALQNVAVIQRSLKSAGVICVQSAVIDKGFAFRKTGINLLMHIPRTAQRAVPTMSLNSLISLST